MHEGKWCWNPCNTLKTVNISGIYILVGVLLFTMNVDCSAPAFLAEDNKILRNDMETQ